MELPVKNMDTTEGETWRFDENVQFDETQNMYVLTLPQKFSDTLQLMEEDNSVVLKHQHLNILEGFYSEVVVAYIKALRIQRMICGKRSRFNKVCYCILAVFLFTIFWMNSNRVIPYLPLGYWDRSEIIRYCVWGCSLILLIYPFDLGGITLFMKWSVEWRSYRLRRRISKEFTSPEAEVRVNNQLANPGHPQAPR